MEIAKKRRGAEKKSKMANNHRWMTYYPPALLTFMGIIFYGSSWRYDFQFDDVANITRQFNIRHGTFWSLFMSGSRWVSYWINTVHYAIGRFNPFSYRLGNSICHILTSLVLFYLIYELLRLIKKESFFSRNAFLIAMATAGLFLLHPVQTQTVSYVIQGQLEGMAGLFMFSSLLTFVYSCQSRRYSSLWSALSLVAAFLACGCKEITIILPVLMVLVDWFFVAQGSWTELKRRWLWHGTVALLVFSLYVYFLKPSFFAQVFGLKMEARNNIGNVLTENAQDKILPLPFFISQFKVIVHYMQIFIWPFNMSVEYDWKLVKGFFALDCLAPLSFLLLLAYGIWRLFRIDRLHPICFAVLWFFIGVLPRSSIIPSSELLSDYKTYVPSVGIIFVLAVALIKFIELLWQHPQLTMRREPYWQVAALALVLMPIGCATYHRNKVWRTAEEFWLNIIANAPGKARAYNNYAVALSERGAYKEAIPFFQKAIDMDKAYPDPLNNIAVAYSVVGNLDKAVDALKQGITINPNYPEAYNNLASFLIKQNKPDQAEQMLNVAIKLRPYYGKAFFNLGKVAMMRNDFEAAHKNFKKACMEADFDNDTGFKVYAEMSMRLKKMDDAIKGYIKLVEVAPTAEHIFGLANAYFVSDKWHDAIRIYEQLAQKTPQDLRVWYNLGESYLKLEQFEKALVALDKATGLKASVPTLCLRRAYCLDRLGRRPEAWISLQEALSYPNLPAQHRQIAQSMLDQAQREGWVKS